ncbi:MAG: alpha/beta hydrolase, partial [Planctomycetes bacterium]|nr:alpha/beta hydrolase [Planctomycetota bacterium]
MPSDRTDFTPGKNSLEMPWGVMSYDEYGGGRPLMLIHGTGRSRRDWEGIIPFLKKRHIVVPDLRGHGGSSVPLEKFSIYDFAADMFKLADKLWLGKFDIIGHSLGGMIALAMLEKRDERIGRIGLLEGWTKLSCGDAFGVETTVGLSREEAVEIRNAYTDTFVRWMPGIREAYWWTVEDFDATRLLQETRHSILEIYGDRGAEKLAPEKLGLPRRENIKLEWISGAGHLLPTQAPESVGKVLAK